MLRVALVHASDLGGGAERSVVSLHRALRADGYESTLFVGEKHTDEPGVEQIPYVRGFPGSRRLARMLERSFGWQDIYNPSFRALSTMLGDRFDVVHFNSLWGSEGYADISALPAITCRLPGIVTLRDDWLLTGHCAYFHDCRRWLHGCGSCPNLGIAPAVPHDGTARNWRRKKESIGAATLQVVAISDYVKQLVESSPIFDGKQVSRIYNGIDLDVFQPIPSGQRCELRQAMGVSDGDVVVLLTGQTVEGIRQGIATHHAVAAFNANADLPGLKALVVGRSAQLVAEQLHAPSVVLPFQSTPFEMARCFQVADVTLVASEVEAFGRIGAESQACGTPVVAFDSGGIPEVVVNGVGGLVVPRRDTARMTDALRRLLKDTVLREQMGRDGLRHVRAHFDQREVVDQYVSLYRNVVAGTQAVNG